MAAYGSAAAPIYGYQAAKNTTSYPSTGGVSVPISRSTVAASPSLYGGQAAKNTTGYNDALYPAVTPLSQPQKTVAPAPPPTAPAKAAGPPPAPATTSLYDYTTDPVLQQVQAQAQAEEAKAHANAVAAQNQLAIQYADPAMALDQTYADTARGNPYGVFAGIASQEPLDQQALDETLNKQNLFYSGARINQQQQLANQYGQKRADAATQEQAGYQQIQATLLAAEQRAEDEIRQGQGDAYNRFLQQLLANPPAAASSSSGGGGSGGGGGQAADVTGGAAASATNPFGTYPTLTFAPNPVNPADLTGPPAILTPSPLPATAAGPSYPVLTFTSPAPRSSSGSYASGAAAVKSGQTKKNYQAAARAA